MKTIKRICLTGGPCSGKTTFTSRAKEIFSERGYRVIIENECATDLISGGISPATIGMYEFQKYVIALQLMKEDLCVKAAQEMQGDKFLVIMDRGLFDDLSYVGEENFKKILSDFDVKMEDINKRYDMVLHLVSSAKGKEEAYSNANNAARYESVDEAKKMDDLTMKAWDSHPNRVVIGNETDFEVKMRKAIQSIFEFTGDGKTEVFNKYLIEVNDDVIANMALQQNYTTSHIIQHYLKSPEGIERRIRKRERQDSVLYSYSEARYLSTNERVKSDRVLSERQYYDYLADVDEALNVIDKDRHSFILHDNFYKLDLFSFDKTKGILSVQVTKDNKDVKLPDYVKVIKDVTEDVNYKNYYLAKSQTY